MPCNPIFGNRSLFDRDFTTERQLPTKSKKAKKLQRGARFTGNLNQLQQDTNGNFINGNSYRRFRVEIYTRDGFACLKCGDKNNLTLDHIKPISKGGKGIVENLQTLCSNCNVKKGSKEIDYRLNVSLMNEANNYS